MKEFTIQEPQIEFCGHREVTVFGCKAILEYEPETVKLNVGKYNIRLNGNGLVLKSLNPEAVMIAGTFTGLEFMA